MKIVTAILIGAGQRGADAYASYALANPNEFKVVAVAEPREERRREFCAAHGIAEDMAFSDWKQLLSLGKVADCALVCTQDNMHVEPAVAAMRAGYDILLEKPISKSADEMKRLVNASKETGRRVSVCHVLRFSPFFNKLKELIDNGAVGQLVHIVQTECVAFWHFAHSYVRGNWRNEEQSSPVILAKSCHDLDILLYLTGKRAVSVSSSGKLVHFKAENAPKGAPSHCLDGCSAAENCPYDVKKLYLNGESWTDSLRKIATGYTDVRRAYPEIATGPYGRCVYRCDNDVPDSQSTFIEFDGGVTATFVLSAFTRTMTRTVNIMGSRGQIIGDMEKNSVSVFDFASGNVCEISIDSPPGGHNGSDVSMMREFVSAAHFGQKLRTDLSESVESHFMALAAEESRRTGKKILLNEFISA